MSFTFHIKETKFVVNDYCNFIRKRSSIQQAIIDIAIKRGYTEFFLSREIQGGKEKENIGNYTKIHPDVYLLKHFDIIVKTFESRDEMLYELSIYELIKNVYKTPEDYGLANLICCGEKYIATPNYGRVLGFDETDKIYDDVAMCISNLHAIGVIHRDIKFTNIAVFNDTTPILFDFGLSCWAPMSFNCSPKTSIQTIWFRAPEIALDRTHKNKTCLSSDWWSYGIILASKNKMIYKPMTNDKLLECLETFFDEDGNGPNEFLHKHPEKRMMIEVIEDIKIPIAENIFKIEPSSSMLLLEYCFNWIMYFTAIDYLYYLTPEISAELAFCLTFRKEANDIEYPHLFDMIEGNFLRLNTFSILTMKYPLHLDTFVFPCFILSIKGVNHPHSSQSEWIENYFIKEINGTFPEIEKSYIANLAYLSKFDRDKLKSLGNFYF